MHAPEDEPLEIFDQFRIREEATFQELKALLGDSFSLIYDLLRLYDTFIDLALKPVFALNDSHQIPALLHSLQWMKHEAIAGTMTIVRGHISDSSNFSRRAIELCAFVSKMYADKEAAKRWMEAGTSNKAQERYLSTFPAWKLVKELLTPDLIAMYEDDCLTVHPSFFAVAKRASLDEDRTHRFSYFDLEEDDEQQTYFIIEFFNLLLCHGKLMAHLTTVFYPSGNFDSEKWMQAFSPFVNRWTAFQQHWKPVTDKRLQQHHDDEEAEKKAAKEKSKQDTKKKSQD